MLQHYHDKQPVAETMQKLVADKAAAEMLFEKGEQGYEKRRYKEPKQRKSICRVILCFVALYLASTILTTLLVKMDYTERFRRNVETILAHLDSKTLGDEVDYVNSIYHLQTAKEENQYVSVALYNEQGEVVAKTVPHIRLEVEGVTYRFALSDYFNVSEIELLLLYAKEEGKEYIVEAEVNDALGDLLSLKFTTTSITYGTVTVWEWKNPNAEQAEVVVNYRNSEQIRQVVRVPHANMERYQEWQEDNYLHEFAEEIHISKNTTKTSKDETQYEIFRQKNTEDGTYWIGVRTTTAPMTATVNMLLSVYIIGGLLMGVGIFFTVHEFKKYKIK